jgi:eukaryotic-like serine/threonine-protein kinase
MGRMPDEMERIPNTTVETAPSGTALTEEARAFLQERVARFGLVAGLGSFFFWLFRVATIALVDGYGIEHPSFWWHLLGAALLLAPWVLCRRAPRPERLIHRVETVGLLAASASYAVMGVYIPLANSPGLVMVLALGLATVARAVYVPSSARRTLLLGLLIGLPVVAATYVGYLDFDPAKWRAVDAQFGQMTPARAALLQGVFVAAWWLSIVAVCTLASSVVFGLRKEVREVRRLGQYVIKSKLGEGGMGTVYRASHALLQRPTAIKLLHPEKIGARSIARFEREVRLTAQLSHPNTVTVFDYGRTPDGVFYYAMELLDGVNLEELVMLDGAQPASRVVSILRQAAGALAEAHGIGLIHRDIKPGNIMLCERGGAPDVVKIVDFGLVKELGRDVATITRADIVTGTPQYMAPETLTAPQDVDGRSDLYALGAVGYFLITGQPVFQGRTMVEVCSHHLHTPPTSPSERLGRTVAHDLERVILDCLAKDPGNRPQTTLDLDQRLAGCDVPAWDTAQAAAWWLEHRSAIRARRMEAEVGTDEKSIAVDLDLRRH